MPVLSIRRAVKADVDAIVRLVNAGGPEGKPRVSLPKELPQEYFEAFRKISSDSDEWLMVAEIDREVIGTFHMTFITYLHAAGKPDCQVEAIHVAEKHRGKGFGSQMLKWAINCAREKRCRRVQLTTDKRRVDAHPFYEKLGFVFSHEGAKLTL